MQCLLTFPVAVRLIAGFVVVLLSADCLIAAERVLTGHQLFVRQWTPEEGLGPVFNARSCVACHFQGGIGGGGPNENNVQLLSVNPPQNLTALERAKFVKRIQAVHPSFSVASPDIVFHKFNVDSTYDQWRRRVLGFVAPKRLNKLMQARFLRKKENQLLQRPVTRLENRGVTMIMRAKYTGAVWCR